MARSTQSGASKFKDIGTGVVLIGGAVLFFYLFKKLAEFGGSAKDAFDAAVKKVSDATGYVLGSENAPSTIGTDLYDYFNTPVPFTLDEQQAIKTCNLAWKRDGVVKGNICLTLYKQGKLTDPNAVSNLRSGYENTPIF